MFRVFSNTLMTLDTRKTRSLPDADDWQNIQKFQRFPLLPSTRRSVQQLMRKTSLSFDGLATIAEQDPALCLHMLQRIKQLHPASLEQIHTAAGCISLLGMEEVVKLVKHLPVLDISPSRRSERNYMAMLHTAVLAGRIAAQWAKFKPSLNQHQAQWSAMLASAPLWPWQLQQVSSSQQTFNHMSQGKDLIPALEIGFGALTKNRLGQWRKLAHNLALPSTCQSLWQHQCWPKPKEWQALRVQKLTSIEGHRALKHQCQQAEMLVYIANALASQYRIGAYRLKTRRWLALSANFLNKEAEDIHQEVISLNLQLARQDRGSAIATLLAPTNTATPPGLVYQCEKQPAVFKMERDAPQPVSNAAIKERKIDHSLLKRLMLQLDKTPESFGDLHYLMRSVLKGITEGIGLKHAYIMVQNKSGTAAKVYYQQGLAETDPLCQFGIELDSASVFKKMLEKPASLMITEHNREKMLRGITATQQSVLPQQFMMMSLFSNERPIGIIFADLGNTPLNLPMQPAEYTAFKSLCMAASKSLGKLAIATQKKVRSENNKAKRRQA
ncbi:MAG: HDOD domain-containing protein [Oleispira sp.]